MSDLLLIVKGDRHEAAEAALARGIPFVFIKERERHGETWGHVGGQHIAAVRAWFDEPGSILLHWSIGANDRRR